MQVGFVFWVCFYFLFFFFAWSHIPIKGCRTEKAAGSQWGRGSHCAITSTIKLLLYKAIKLLGLSVFAAQSCQISLRWRGVGFRSAPAPPRGNLQHLHHIKCRCCHKWLARWRGTSITCQSVYLFIYFGHVVRAQVFTVLNSSCVKRNLYWQFSQWWASLDGHWFQIPFENIFLFSLNTFSWVHYPERDVFLCLYFSLSCAFTTLSFQAKPWKPWNFCLRIMIHMMQLNGSSLSILLNTFHITSQSFNLYDAWEISVQWKYLHMSLFWPEA